MRVSLQPVIAAKTQRDPQKPVRDVRASSDLVWQSETPSPIASHKQKTPHMGSEWFASTSWKEKLDSCDSWPSRDGPESLWWQAQVPHTSLTHKVLSRCKNPRDTRSVLSVSDRRPGALRRKIFRVHGSTARHCDQELRTRNHVILPLCL